MILEGETSGKDYAEDKDLLRFYGDQEKRYESQINLDFRFSLSSLSTI